LRKGVNAFLQKKSSFFEKEGAKPDFRLKKKGEVPRPARVAPPSPLFQPQPAASGLERLGRTTESPAPTRRRPLER